MSTLALAGSTGSRRKSRFVPSGLLSLPRRQRLQRQFQCDTGICWGRRNKLPVFALEGAAFARRRGLLVLASKGILAQPVSPHQRRIVSRSSVTSRRYAPLHVLLQNLLPHQRCVT